ncbi:MAG: peptidylprolyl isomerase [Myxococcota bacterium]|nr:peptidylprolyl isomerase [Myxococcota bacterium]
MKVKKNSIVTIQHRMTLASGEEVDTSTKDTPLQFICGRGDVITGLERQLIGLVAGDRKSFAVLPDQGYGAHDPMLVKKLPRAGFPSDRVLAVGQSFSYRSKQGAELRYRVTSMTKDTITADFNHPLAGKTLHYDVEILSVLDDS